MSESARDQRLEAVESRLALRELLSRYAYAVDNRDIDALAELFAEDASFGTRNGSFAVHGRAAIAAEFRAQLGNMGPSFHYIHDHILDLDPSDPDRAKGVATAHAEVRRQDGLWQTAIRYHDNYVRQHGRWRFQARELAFLYYVRAPGDSWGDPDRRVIDRRGAVPADWPEQLPSWKAFHGGA
nr:nuclear transport factor 2 family protein [Sphingomonas sp. Y57]